MSSGLFDTDHLAHAKPAAGPPAHNPWGQVLENYGLEIGLLAALVVFGCVAYLATRARQLRLLSNALLLAGAGAFAGLFLIVLTNGTWPDFLEPVQSFFQALHGYLGPLAFVIQVALFAGPGVVVMWFAEKAEARGISNGDTPT